jgi:GTP-binding protein HflX
MTVDLTAPTARAIIVGVELTGGGSGYRGGWTLESSLDELERLASTADVEIVNRLTQRLAQPNVRTFIGSGKVKELKVQLEKEKLRLLIFDEELSPRQQVNLEKELSKEGALEEEMVRVMDRTSLILDIFASHATTREGKLQVELATLEYELPRLRGKWSHLEAEKLGGGVGARFGMGESQLETDRRLARKRISELKRELKRVAQEREVQRSKRMASGVYKVSFVGYTNAGKSTLLNGLTDADVLAYDKLFATLDSTTRRHKLATGREITLTDTVGFINKLPHSLVAAFKSTLDEVNEADLLLHVVDASSEQYGAQIASVEEVLEEIGAHDRPAMLVFNKMDLVPAGERDSFEKRLGEQYPDAVFISATKKTGFEELLLAIERYGARSSETMDVLIPFTKGDLVELAYTRTTIVEESYTEEGTRMVIRVPSGLVATFSKYCL